MNNIDKEINIIIEKFSNINISNDMIIDTDNTDNMIIDYTNKIKKPIRKIKKYKKN